jgi:cell cycle sensor histidine kinase DivJ
MRERGWYLRAGALRLIDWFNPARDYVDRLVHPSAKSDPLVAARHRAFIAAQLTSGLIALASFPAYLALRGGMTSAEAVAFALLVSPVLVATLLSRTGRYEPAHLLASLCACALAAVVSTRTGGLGSFALAWLIIVPFEAALSGSRKLVGYAAGLAVATVGIVLALQTGGLVGEPTGLAASPLFQAGGLVAAAAYAGGLAFLSRDLQSLGAELTRSGEARYAMLAENMNDLVTGHSEVGQVTYASPASSAVLGVRPQDIAGQALFDRVHVSDRPAYLSALSQARAQATTVEFRIRRDTAEGPRFIWAEMRCRPFMASPTERVVAVMRDISDRKEHELQIEAARSEAEIANAAKSRFLATMSHELRTPLNAVIGFSEMIINEDSLPLDPQRRRNYAELIHESGHHLLGVVNGILDMSKIETGNFHIVAEPFIVRGLVEGCRSLMLLKAESSSIGLDASIDPSLPEVVGDKRACRQILLNLLSNALKFTPAGGRVVVGARSVPHGFTLFVSDTGTGIEKEALPRLGEPFFQAKSSYDRPFEGTGLGLSVVKGLAQLHGGRMEVDSSVGRGTTVTVHLPLDCESEPCRRALAENANQDRVEPLFSRERVIEQGKRRA